MLYTCCNAQKSSNLGILYELTDTQLTLMWIHTKSLVQDVVYFCEREGGEGGDVREVMGRICVWWLVVPGVMGSPLFPLIISMMSCF